MRDNRYTNMWGENPEDQEKRRQWLSDVYDNATADKQTSYAGSDSQNTNLPTTGESEPDWLDKAAYASDGAMQGLSFGFADEMEGAMGGLGYGLASLNSDWNKRGESVWDAAKRGYVQARDARRNHLQEGYEKAPAITRAAEAVGSVVSPLNKIGAVSNLAPRSVQMAQGMKNAVQNGAVYGLGAGQGEVGSQIGNMGLGAAGGLAGNVLGRHAQPAINSMFMNQTGRSLARNATENAIGDTAQYGINELEDYWKRHRF